MRKVEVRLAGNAVRNVSDVAQRAAGVARERKEHPEHLEARQLQKWIRKARRLPSVRTDLVQRVRAQIVDGTYDTQEKLQVAVDRLLRELAEERE